jgi:dimethylamine monooxygenase subunit A
MGMRPLNLATWLQLDERREEELALKTELLEHHYDTVVATEAGGDAASHELLDEVKSFLTAYHPLISTATYSSEHPIVQASRLVQEDFCVLLRDDAWRLLAACVCFPSRWDLTQKIGTTLDEIHSPVPGYDGELSTPTNSFFDRLRPERSYWRLNWTLLDQSDLFQPQRARLAPGGELADWFFRVERQTLRQLSHSNAIVFTIRTYVASALSIAATDEQFLPALLHGLDTAPAEIQGYKGWTGVAARLRDSITSE